MKLWKYFKGRVRIAVRGFSKERFIDLLAANNIFAWDIKTDGSELTLYLTVSGLKRIKPLLRKTGCRFRILSRGGFPFTLRKYRHRGFFAAGLAAFFILMFLMSQFIWLIEIDGNSAVSDTELLEFFKQRGVTVGTFKHKANPQKLKEDIIENFPQISWVSITQNGTRLLAEISENVKNTDILDYSQPCDIISIKECIITDIIVQNGTPAVKPGDTVRQGDTLISAAFDIKDDNGETAALQPVHAVGSVRGKWRQTLVFDIPYKHSVKKYTGRTKAVYGIKFFGKDLSLGRSSAFQKYDVIKRKKQIGFSPNYPLPFVLSRTIFCEYETKDVLYTRSQAEKRAEVIANKKLITEIPHTAEILEKKISLCHEKNALKVTVGLLVEDDIGKEEKHGGKAFNGTNEASDR